VITCLAAGACSVTRTYEPSKEVIFERRNDAGTERYTIGSGGTLNVHKDIQRPSGYLGIEASAVTQERAERMQITPFDGVYVEKVQPGSPADLGGLIPGDIVLSIDDQQLHSPDQFKLLVSKAPLDRDVTLNVYRQNTERELRARLESRPVAERSDTVVPLPAIFDAAMVGMEISTLPPNVVQEIWGADAQRAIVSQVLVGGPAYFAGLRTGDVIGRCNGQPIATAQEFFSEIRRAGPDKTVEVSVQDSDRSMLFDLPIEQDFTGGTEFYFPFLFDYQSDQQATDLDIGWFLVNYEKSYHETKRRQPSSNSEFSLLLHLFEVENTDDSTCISLLWFIHLNFD